MSVLGIDVGTQGARAKICDAHGAQIAQAERPFAPFRASNLPEGHMEQNPLDWWTATIGVVREAVHQWDQGKPHAVTIDGVSVTSTSGTVVAVDEEGNALGSALMYNDRRSAAEAHEVDQAGRGIADKLGYQFASSFALPKVLWLERNDPERFRKARYFLSPTDFIIGRLTGEFGVTDYTNALKMGCDLIDLCWPDFIETSLGIPLRKLPRVVAPGQVIGTVNSRAAKETGLAVGMRVLAGMTDGCASQVSTGAVAPDQWNSTIGTTLVIKGVTSAILRDPAGRIYCHRHPDGHWLPGGASNTGGECIARTFEASKLNDLGVRAAKLTPTNLIAYPLMKTGERFPFVDPDAKGFLIGESSDEATLYTAYLEGVGYVERLAFEVVQGLGGAVGNDVYVAGGATKSAAWLQIRADILQKTLRVPAHSGGAMGAAIIAASGTIYPGIVPAARAMVNLVKEINPRPSLKTAYDERYGRFCAELRRRGYLEESVS